MVLDERVLLFHVFSHCDCDQVNQHTATHVAVCIKNSLHTERKEIVKRSVSD